jgi:LPXTG-site transpeptidase (sortase) family protein
MARVPAFQAGYAGSIPVTRSMSFRTDVPRPFPLPHRTGFRRWLLVIALIFGVVFGNQTVSAIGGHTSTSDLTARREPDVGRMYIPRLRAQVWGMPIYAGVSDDELDLGFGWFPTSVEPGMAGNFAVAGHRTEAKRPLYFVEKLRKGDEVIVRTDAAWFVYRLTSQRIVTPRSTWVLDPVPDPALRATPDAVPRLITLVTCTPRGTTRQRWIWWGSLSAVYPPDSPPPSIGRTAKP